MQMCTPFDPSKYKHYKYFPFYTIFAQNLAILPQKWEVTHFQEVYQTFSHFWNIKETNHIRRLLSSENSHGSQICYITNSTIEVYFTKIQFYPIFLHPITFKLVNQAFSFTKKLNPVSIDNKYWISTFI